jgi:superoxide dismutase
MSAGKSFAAEDRETRPKPILSMDVRERADYLKAVWHVIDWNAVAKGF